MEERNEFLRTRINESIQEFRGRRKKMYRIVRLFIYPTVALTMGSTIVLGVELGEEWIVHQKNIALILGAVVTALVTLRTFWNVDEYWIKNKVIELQLLSLKNSLDFESKTVISDVRINEFFQQYQGIINQREELWKISSDQGSQS